MMYTVREQILLQFNNYRQDLKGATTQKVQQINYLLQSNYWIHSKGATIGVIFFDLPVGFPLFLNSKYQKVLGGAMRRQLCNSLQQRFALPPQQKKEIAPQVTVL